MQKILYIKSIKGEHGFGFQENGDYFFDGEIEHIKINEEDIERDIVLNLDNIQDCIISALKKGFIEASDAIFDDYQISEHIDDDRYTKKKHFYTKIWIDLNDKGFYIKGKNKGINYYTKKPWSTDGMDINGNYYRDEYGFDYKSFKVNGEHKNGTYYDDMGITCEGKKKEDIYNELLDYLSKYDFDGVRNYYKDNNKYIEIDRFKNQINNYKQKYLKILDFENKKNKVLQKLNNYLIEHDFNNADKIYLENESILKEFDYKDQKRNYFLAYIQAVLIEHDFDNADKIWFKDFKSKYGTLDTDEYKEIKTSYVIQYLENLLSKGKFQKSDDEFLKFNDDEFLLDIKYNEIKKEYIKNFLNTDEINDEKYDVLADNTKYTLVKARAGTGKSKLLKYKTKFLNKGYNIDSLNILIFSFNKKTAKEMNENIIDIKNKKINGIPYFDGSMTFHRFAGTMVLGMNKEWNKVLSDIKTNNEKSQSEVVQDIVREELSNNENLINEMYQYFRKEVDELEKGNILINKLDYYEKIRNTTYEGKLLQETLNGEFVKSVGEKWIADFLFEHDISYKYESSFYSNLRNGLKETYNPDFLLTNFNVDSQIQLENTNPFTDYVGISKDGINGLRISIPGGKKYPEINKTIIEHRGIDLNSEKKEVPNRRSKSREEYRDEIEWKRAHLNKEGYSLIETGVGVINYKSPEAREKFESFIKGKLEEVHILCNRMPLQDIINKVKDKEVARLTGLFINYIKKAKQKGYSFNYIIKKTKTISCSDKAKIFYKLANDIYKKYENYLKKNDLMDMEDVLQKAIKKLDEVKGDIYIKRKDHNNNNKEISLLDIEYLMVDEYQDCNRLFFEIIDRIRKYNNKIKILCVGDDRQLINGFAGSDIYYFENFNTLFSPSKTFLLAETFRCPNTICKLANKFYGEQGGSYSNIFGGIVKGFDLDKEFIEMREDNRNNYKEDEVFFPKEREKELDNNGNPMKDSNGEYIYKKSLEGQYIYTYNRKMYNLKYARYIKILFNLLISNTGKIYVLDRTEMMFGYKQIILKRHLVDLFLSLYKNRYKETENKRPNNENLENIKRGVEDKIIFMNIHQSKGLQADVVVLLEIGSSKYPMIHPDNELNIIFDENIQDVLNEERRLFYVALTRTQNTLYYISEKPITNLDEPEKFLINSRNG